MPVLYPKATWRPCANQSKVMSAHLGLVLHVQVGTNDLLAEFNNPASQASYTWVAYPDGHGDQFCDAAAHAWAQGDGNDTYNSVGTSGFPAEPLSEACCLWIAGLYVWGHHTYGWPYVLSEAPGESGFGWHGMGDSNGHHGWGGHPGCPGDIRKAQRQHILDLAQSLDSNGGIDMDPKDLEAMRKEIHELHQAMVVEPIDNSGPSKLSGSGVAWGVNACLGLLRKIADKLGA